MLENQQVILEIVAHETFNDELSSPSAFQKVGRNRKVELHCDRRDDERYWFMKSFIPLQSPLLITQTKFDIYCLFVC